MSRKNDQGGAAASPINFVSPATGHALPQLDEASIDREAAAWAAFKTVVVEYEPQRRIKLRIEGVRRTALPMPRGEPLPGARLSQVSQAGKTWTLRSYIAELHASAAAAGLQPNPLRVIYVGLKRRISVKMLYQRILKELGDPHSHDANVNVEVLAQRGQELIVEKGVELLIVDEVQHLANKTTDNKSVTDELKSFVDDGLVPVIWAGNEDSREFFEENQQLAARLGTAIELDPVNPKRSREIRLFRKFLADLDAGILATGVVDRPAGLDRDVIVRGLGKAAGGHVGRVCRIVEEAIRFKARRGGTFIEPYDLSWAVRHYAMPAKWLVANPFPEPEDW